MRQDDVLHSGRKGVAGYKHLCLTLIPSTLSPCAHVTVDIQEVLVGVQRVAVSHTD